MLKFTECGNIITLENGIEIFMDEWNGEVYTVKENGKERNFKPIQKPISFNDDGDVEQWEIICFEEI